jgi:hypothetical protein
MKSKVKKKKEGGKVDTGDEFITGILDTAARMNKRKDIYYIFKQLYLGNHSEFDIFSYHKKICRICCITSTDIITYQNNDLPY